MRMAGRLKTKTVHGVRTGNHSNPHVLKAAQAYSGEAGGKVDGEDARRSFSETPRTRRADGGSVLGKVADVAADLAMPGRAMGRGVQKMAEGMNRAQNERTARETRETMPEGPARFGAGMGKAMAERADGGGVKISADSQAKAKELRESAKEMPTAGLVGTGVGMGTYLAHRDKYLPKKTQVIGKLGGAALTALGVPALAKDMAKTRRQLNEADSIERGEAEPGREDGDKVQRARGGGLGMMKPSMKGKQVAAMKAKDPMAMSMPTPDGKPSVLPSPKDGELPMPARKRGGSIRDLMKMRKGGKPAMDDDEDDDE